MADPCAPPPGGGPCTGSYCDRVDPRYGPGYPNCAKNHGRRTVRLDFGLGAIFTRVYQAGGIIPLQRAVATIRKINQDQSDPRKYKVRLCGTYCCRHINNPSEPGSNAASPHSWPVAIDINWDTNPFHNPNITDIPEWFKTAFTDNGFRWGGEWHDTMHFERLSWFGTQGDGGPPGGGQHVNISMYRNPVRDDLFIPERIAEGVHYFHQVSDVPPVELAVYALGKARVVFRQLESNSQPGLLVYQLMEGPVKGARVFIRGSIIPTVHVTDIVDTGIRVALLRFGGDGMEIGWWSRTENHSLARDFGGFNLGDRTACGQNFSDLIRKLGGKAGLGEGRPILGTTPEWLPDWKDATTDHCSGGHTSSGGDLCGGRYDLGKVLATIRRLESGGVCSPGGYAGCYQAQNAHSSASGAYQYIDGTWNNYKGYAHAKLAPKNIQDERAAADVRHILSDNNCSLKWVPAVWFAGSSGAHTTPWNQPPTPSNNLTIQEYVDLWMGYYDDVPDSFATGTSGGMSGSGHGDCSDGGGGHGDGGGGGGAPVAFQSYDIENLPRGLEHMKSDYYYMLFDSHQISVRAQLYDQNEHLIGPLLHDVVTGQVDVDLTQPIPKQLSMDFVMRRPGDFKKLIWGDNPGSGENGIPGSPNQKGDFHPAHFIRVQYGVLVHRPRGQKFPSGMPPSEHGTLNTWIWHTVFYGVPTNITADEVASTLHVEAQSKEFLYQLPNTLKWTPATQGAFIKLGSGNTQVGKMIQLIASTYGESRFRTNHAHEVVYTGRNAERKFIKQHGVWPYLQKLAKGAGYNVFFDREGYLALRKKQNFAHVSTVRIAADLSNHPFKGSPASTVATLPTPGYDATKWINQVVVSSPLSNSSQRPVVRAVVYVQPDERGSYVDLSRDGVDRAMTENVVANGRLTAQKAVDLGNRTMAQVQAQVEEFQVDCLPFPHLDLYETIAVYITDVDEGQNHQPTGAVAIPQKWSLPLVPSQLMTVGFNAPVEVITQTTTARVVHHKGYNPESVYRT